MNIPRNYSALIFALVFALIAPSQQMSVSAQGAGANASATPEQKSMGALQRGYRTGYSDGYQAGWRDVVERAANDYRGKEDYRRGDRAYAASYGALEDYRDGYQQGFEFGYDAGYQRRAFDSGVPQTLARRGADQPSRRGATTNNNRVSGGQKTDSDVNNQTESVSSGRRTTATANTTNIGTSIGTSIIPGNTVMRIELMNRLSSDVSRQGDRFEARVIEPSEYGDAIVSGRVTRVSRPGKTRGKAELQLDFDQIRLPGSEWHEFSAQVVTVEQTGDDEGVGEVDSEGGMRGKDSTKDDVTQVSTGAGIGAIIGAIAGGGKGAAIGAAIGGGAGAGRVLTQRGRDIRLEPGQRMQIRTSGN